MGFLVHVLLAVGVLALGQGGVGLGVEAPWAVPLLVPVPYLVVFAAREVSTRGRWRVGALVGRLGHFAGPLCFALACGVAGWPASVERWAGRPLDLDRWPAPAAGLAFVPFVLFQLLAIDAEARAAWPPSLERGRWRRFQVRMFASALLPMAVFGLAVTAVGANPTLRAWVEHVELLSGLLLGLMMVVLALCLPFLLRNTWETVDLPPGPERTLFDAVSQRAGFRAARVMVWQTGHLMANAAIVGLLPARRLVLLSDSLLNQLGRRELACVYGHEIGHSKLHHVPIFLGWTLFFLMGSDLVLRELDTQGVLLGVGVLLGALMLWLLVFGWLSRRFELQADLYSLRLLNDPMGMANALVKVSGRLRDVAGWRHFSTDERIDFLHRAASEPGFAQRFDRRMGRLGALGLVLGGLALVGQLVVLARAYPEDALVAELALGRYGAASARAEAIGTGLDGDLARLTSRALELGGDAPDVAPLDERLGSALAAGDLGAARDWAELAALRGDPDLWSVVDLLQPEPRDEDAAASADRAWVDAELRDVPERHRATLRRLLVGG